MPWGRASEACCLRLHDWQEGWPLQKRLEGHTFRGTLCLKEQPRGKGLVLRARQAGLHQTR